jgi:hypothetical protein
MEGIMALYNWLKSGKNKNEGVNVEKLPDEDIGNGEMAAGYPTGAANSIKRMMDQTNGPTKILVVGDGRYSKRLRDYSLKMAQRLDCEIVALNMSKAPLHFSGERANTEADMFSEIPANNIGQFIEQSQIMGINVVPIRKTGDRDKVVAQLSAQDPKIRYVLTEPDYEREKGIEDIPFLDLAYPYNDI